MATKKPDLSETTVARATIDIQLGSWFRENLEAAIDKRFPDHVVEQLRVTDWDGYGDGFVTVEVDMTQ